MIHCPEVGSLWRCTTVDINIMVMSHLWKAEVIYCTELGHTSVEYKISEKGNPFYL